jgi:hypothetical protein
MPVFVALALVTGTLHAHPLAPSSLRLVEAKDGVVLQRFRTPAMRPVGSSLVPIVPRGCALLAPPRVTRTGSAVEETKHLRCEGSVVGKTFTVRGVANARANVVWQLLLADGTTAQGLLHGRADSFDVPSRTRPIAVFGAYLRLGVEHLITGFDHVLFLLALLFILDRRGALAFAITAFTLGHSASLALTALDVVRVPEGPVEVAIAASLVFMALEILRRRRLGPAGQLERRPALFAGLFGLVHGLGFAAVLAEAGLPAAAAPEALLGFNLGIEIGQLALVACAPAAAATLRRFLPPRLLPGRLAAAYVTGSLAAMWIVERALVLVT